MVHEHTNVLVVVNKMKHGSLALCQHLSADLLRPKVDVDEVLEVFLALHLEEALLPHLRINSVRAH